MKKEETQNTKTSLEMQPGTTAFQIRALTGRIEYLSVHLKRNIKDIKARRSLLRCVAIRKRFIRYEKR